MSLVHVILIEEKTVLFFVVHYRSLELYLKTGALTLLSEQKVVSDFLDSGYLLIDLNEQIIIDAQDAISVTSFDLFSEFRYLQV